MKISPLAVIAGLVVFPLACGSDDEPAGNGAVAGTGATAASAGQASGGESSGGESSGGDGPGLAGAGGGSTGGTSGGGAGGADGGGAGAFSRFSVDLDGETGYLALGAFSDIVAGDAVPLSISVWVKARGEITSGAGIVNLKSTGSFGQSLDLFWSTELDEPSVAFYLPGGDMRAIIEEPNAWNHIVAVYDPEALSDSGRLYVNGELAQTLDTASADLDIDGESEAGRYATTLYLDGLLDDLAIWHAALSDEAVAAIYNQGQPSDLNLSQGAYDAAADLVAYWRMGDDDGGEGTTVSDVAAGHDATLEGGVEFSEDVP